MLHDGSDSEYSLTDDGEGDDEEERRTAEGRGGGEGREGGGGGGEGGKSDTIPVYVPLPVEVPTITSSAGMEEGKIEKKKAGEEGEKETATTSEEEKGDPEMAPVYLKKMLPVFAELFHSSLAPTLRFMSL